MATRLRVWHNMTMPLKPKVIDKPKNEQLEHERLNSLINSMADAVIAVDQDARIVLYNGAALNILDVNNIDIGVELSVLFQPIDKNNQRIDVTSMVLSSTLPITNRDLRLKYSDGSLINLYFSIAPVRLGYAEKGMKGYVLMLRDITREKSLEEERDEFISVVSHELRTPIAIAEGNISNAQYSAAKSSDEQVNKELKTAHEQIMFLADMINDLSTLSRAERGRLQVEVEAINVHELVNELVKSYTPECNEKHLELKYAIDPSLELLQSSRLYVREVLQNFITNAIKYTTRGSITLSVKGDQIGAFFSVSDTGIGISKADQQRVFDKFFRSEDFRTRQAKGTGLGLYVTMKLARLIHAEIRLSSELNKGSTFTIFIPNLK